MNVDLCANCLMHGWDQVSDKSRLQRCQSCKVVLYCGKECQKEHWFKIHKNQCEYLKDPTSAEGMQHKRENCAICKQADKVGQLMLKNRDNPNYGCVYEGFQWPSSLYHPHPFPITGQQEDTYEKGIIVLVNLLKKVDLTEPLVKRNCKKELDMVFSQLMYTRCLIWGNKKIFPKSLTQRLDNSTYDPGRFYLMFGKIKRNLSKTSPFDLWKVFLLVNDILVHLNITKELLVLKDPLVDCPDEFQLQLDEALNNSDKFLSRANQVLDALNNQLISFHDVLLIICGGSLEKTCSLCSKEITISNHYIFDEAGATVVFNTLFMDEYFCERENCRDKMKSLHEDFHKFQMSVITLYDKRKKNRCDNCYQLPPGKAVHRCTACWSTMYCSKDCQAKDWKVHKKVCKEDLEERKKKSGGKDRKKEAKDALEKLEDEFQSKDGVTVRGWLGRAGGGIPIKVSMDTEIIKKFKKGKNDKKAEK